MNPRLLRSICARLSVLNSTPVRPWCGPVRCTIRSPVSSVGAKECRRDSDSPNNRFVMACAEPTLDDAGSRCGPELYAKVTLRLHPQRQSLVKPRKAPRPALNADVLSALAFSVRERDRRRRAFVVWLRNQAAFHG